MSKNNLFINDPKAEEIISKVKFNFEDLKQSKWLSMYMALRAKIIDEICNRYITQNPNTTVIHLGCGLDSRCLRVDNNNISWYDIDFQSVIDLRKQFYEETEKYKMIGKSVTDLSWLDEIDLDNQSVLIVAEGLTMYLSEQELQQLIKGINNKDSNLELHNVYTSTKLTSMCFAILDQVVRHENLQIKTCLNCGRYFIPNYRQNEIYCDLANPDQSPTCKEKGANEQYKKNLENNKAQALYRRIYRQKFMIAQRNKDSKTIQKDFEQWKREAKDKVNKMKKGKLTEDEVYKWLVESKQK